ncbi:MAG: hypothetical protein H0U71_03120 [Gammaproteobacteria bacterium]|nr:hypothetical protein [Gammaproteobacteria bacterium]
MQKFVAYLGKIARIGGLSLNQSNQGLQSSCLQISVWLENIPAGIDMRQKSI